MTDYEETPCIRGCAYQQVGDEPAKPKGASHGALCGSCFYRLGGALTLIPDLIANMRAQLFSLGATDYSERVSGGNGDAPAPLNLGPLDAADALFAKLHSWCNVFAAEMHVAPPEVPSWANGREVQGLKPVSIEAAHLLATWLCDWLNDRAETIAASPSVAAYWEDIIVGHEDARGVQTLCNIYGIEPRPVRAADKRECPVCGAVEVFAKMPDNFDPEIAVICGKCAWVADPKLTKKHLASVVNG